MDAYTLSAAVMALWRMFTRGVKAAIVRAAMAGWLPPEWASWLLRRLRLVGA